MTIEVDFDDCLNAYIEERSSSYRGISVSDVEGPIKTLIEAVTRDNAVDLILSLIDDLPKLQKDRIREELMEEEPK